MHFSSLHHDTKKLNCNFITGDSVGNPSKGKRNKGSSLMSRSIEAWVMHACTHACPTHTHSAHAVCTQRGRGCTCPGCVHQAHTYSPTLFLHSSPVWHTSSKAHQHFKNSPPLPALQTTGPAKKNTQTPDLFKWKTSHRCGYIWCWKEKRETSDSKC